MILNDLPWKQTDHSVIFEIASKYCISNSFVDYDGYSISSKGTLPTVVDIMVIWVKCTHSSPSWFLECSVHWFLECWCSPLSSPVWPTSVVKTCVGLSADTAGAEWVGTPLKPYSQRIIIIWSIWWFPGRLHLQRCLLHDLKTGLLRAKSLFPGSIC